MTQKQRSADSKGSFYWSTISHNPLIAYPGYRAKYKRFATLDETKVYITPAPRPPPRQSRRKSTSGKRIRKPRKQKHTPYPLPPSLFPTNASRPPPLPFHTAEASDGGFTVTSGGALVVYTDGSATGNGKRGCVSGTGVWWGARGRAATL